MALVVADRIKETTSTTGTGTYTLGGASTGFEAFSVIGNGNTTYYCCTDGTDFEVGIGTYTLSGTTLARTTILQSSNDDSAVNWGSGTRDIFVTQPAEKAVYRDANGYIDAFDGRNLTNLNASNVSSGTLSEDRLPSGGAGAATYGSISNGTKIDTITLDAKGRVTAVATGATGDILGVTAGTGLSGGGSSGTVRLDLDFSELTDMTGDISGTTEFILQNGTTESRKAASEIGLSAFDNDAGFTTNTGDITGVTAGTGLSGGGSSGSVTLNVSGLTVSELAANSLTTSAESFADNDTTLMTSAAINDRIESFGYTTNTGDITGVTAGTGLSGGGNSGSVTLNVSGLTVSELAANSLTTSSESFADNDTTLMTSAAINDRIESFGYSTTTGTVTSVGTTGTVNGITLTGTVTSSGNLTLGGTLGSITVSQLAGSALTTSAESFADNDTTLMTSAAINDRIESFGYTTNTGDITGVTAGTGLSGGGSSGSVTLNVSGLTVSELAANSLTTSSESFADNDTTLMTSAAINDRIESFGYTTNTGDITGVTAGTGLSGGGSSGGVTLNVDLSELTDMTATMVGTDEFIVLDNGADRRKAANEIPLSIFNNDSGFITNADGGNAQTLDSLDSTSFLRSDAADTKTSGNLTFSDNIELSLGTGNDLRLRHDGTDSYISNKTGDLYIGANDPNDVGGDVYIRAKIGENDTSIRLQDDSGIVFYSNGSVTIQSYSSFLWIYDDTTLQSSADLILNGGNLVFDTGTYNTTITSTTGTAARTITLPNATGTVLTTGNSDTPTTTTSSSDADFVLVDDGGTMKKITPANLGISSDLDYGLITSSAASTADYGAIT